jgi:hypothetical protein
MPKNAASTRKDGPSRANPGSFRVLFEDYTDESKPPTMLCMSARLHVLWALNRTPNLRGGLELMLDNKKSGPDR